MKNDVKPVLEGYQAAVLMLVIRIAVSIPFRIYLDDYNAQERRVS